MSVFLVCVDEADNEIGVQEKMEVHCKGLLHRAFSIFIFRLRNNQEELLIHKRAMHKYHTPGLWTNTCCSHAEKGIDLVVTAQRRLMQEMGFNCPLVHAGWFIYRAILANQLIEHEVDHVFVGSIIDVEVIPSLEEVEAFRWITIPHLIEEYTLNPSHFTPWFYEALQKALSCH